MYARVKQDCKFGTITAFGGREYTKRGWLFVPSANEDEARRHPLLDISESFETVPVESEYIAPKSEPQAEAEPVTDEPPSAEIIVGPDVRAEAEKRAQRRGRGKN